MKTMIYRWRLWKICRKVILYGLVRGVRTKREIIKLAGKDPDCIFPTYHARLEIFIREYKKVAKDAGIEVTP